MSSLRISELEKYPDWKSLLTELLAAIAKRLTSIEDYASFRGVCTSWRSAATFHNFDTEIPRVPRLMYFVEEEEEEEEEPPVLLDALSETPYIYEKTVTNFLDLESNTIKIVNFPPATDYRYLSSFGWILSVSDDYVKVSLKHFMFGINIKLPGLNTFTFHNSFIRKMVLSGSPIIEDDLLVMVNLDLDEDQLAFCRPGDESWTVIYTGFIYFYDIIYHNRKLYALDFGLRIVECDVHGSNPTKTVQVFTFLRDDRIQFGPVEHFFLVESSGKLLIVFEYKLKYKIFEIELKDGSYKLIDNLGNKCQFLSLHSSICVGFPASSGVKMNTNCIYFANKRPYRYSPHIGVYIGVYTLCDGRFEDYSDRFDFGFSSPFWVVPSI